MPPPRKFRKTNLDHLADVLVLLEEAEKSLGRLDLTQVNARSLAVIPQIRAALAQAKLFSADAIDALVGRTPEPEQPEPRVTRPRQARTSQTEPS